MSAQALILVPILTSLYNLWSGIILLPSRVVRAVLCLPRTGTWHRSRGPSLPITQHPFHESLPWILPESPTISDIPAVPSASPWLEPNTLAKLRRANANDIRCISWILWNITNQEALDVAIRLAGMVRWFEEGLNVVPPYNLIVSILRACFDSSGRLRPRSRDRAYYSAQAVLWIYVRAMCISEEFAGDFPLPIIDCEALLPDHDLQELLEICALEGTPHILARTYRILPGITPMHLQWTSNVLLHLSWAKRNTPHAFGMIGGRAAESCKNTIPSNTILNRLLASCIFLGWSIGAVVLIIQDKSYAISSFLFSKPLTISASDHSERIASEISQAIVSAIYTSHPRLPLLPHILRDVANWEDRPSYLTTMAYEWCSVMCENHWNPMDGDQLLSLEIGFRNLDPGSPRMAVGLVHTEHHQRLADVVFESADDEAIADLLHAWTSTSDSHEPPTWFKTCARHLIELRSPSPRLRRLIIRSVGLIGFKVFRQVGVEGFVQLLDDLRVSVGDMDATTDWTLLLLDVVKSREGARHLSHPYWELLVEVAILESPWARSRSYSPRTTACLEGAQEWDKLERWIGVVWMLWPPGANGATEDELERVMALLSHNRPDSTQNLEQWMERWSKERDVDIPESFQTANRHAKLYDRTRRKFHPLTTTRLRASCKFTPRSRLTSPANEGVGAFSSPPPLAPSPLMFSGGGAC